VLRVKFEWDGYSLNNALETLRKITNRVAPTETLDVIKYDSPGNRILECAITAKSDFIVSEDNDLLRLGNMKELGS
jgi:predicted nucleic acid-binding protein